MRVWLSHHKCATQWQCQILIDALTAAGLKGYVYDNFTCRSPSVKDLKDFDMVFIHNPITEDVQEILYHCDKGLHTVRDPRDIITSAYFSHLKTHPDWYPRLKDQRAKLQTISKEDGMISTINFLGGWILDEMYKWDYHQPHITEWHMEDLIEDPFTTFTKILQDLDIQISSNKLKEILETYSFKKLSNGHDRGHEDTNNHYRKGVSGDWKNHFTPKVTDAFERGYGRLIDKMGYGCFQFIQVGSNDGVSQDLIGDKVRGEGWNGILVEPIPTYFEQLKMNYQGHLGLSFEQVAIASDSGYRKIYYVAPEEVEKHGLPEWVKLLGSFSLDHIKKHVGDAVRVDCVSVPCMPLSDLVEKYHVEKLDLLAIDAEGYDFEVLKSLDFNKINPRQIVLEIKHLDQETKAECFAFLKQNGYTIYAQEDGDKNVNACAVRSTCLRKAIATVCNKRFLVGFEVMLKSLVSNNNLKPVDWEIVVLSVDLKERDLRRARTIYPRIKLHNIVFSKYEGIQTTLAKDMPGANGSYLKYEVFSLDDYDQVIFLDSDTVILGDLSLLLDSNCGFGAVHELYIDQFNTGVMVIGKQYLQKRVTDELIQWTRDIGATEHADQDIINMYFSKGIIQYFPIGYNFLKIYHKQCFDRASLAKHIKILHYVIKKPWMLRDYDTPIEQGCHYLERYWWDYQHKLILEEG